MKIIEKLITAIISALLFSLGLSLYTDAADSYAFYLFYSSIAYLVAGMMFSIFADRILKKVEGLTRVLQYVSSVLLYAIGGVVFNVYLYFAIISGWYSGVSFMMFAGIIASLLYLHVLYVVRKR